ncbi:MAG: hypothetical protein K5891_09650 [Lachnospiraceae bacterium]|nr:hypothetical protein [Lachnospiraceae bacterium]
MENRTKKKRIFSFLLIMTTGFLFLTGLSFGKKVVSLDTESYPVYQHRKVFTVVNAANHGSREEWKSYDGAYVALFGYAQDVKYKNKSFDLSISELEDSTSVSCKASDTNVANEIATLTAGKPVVAYGKLSVNDVTRKASLALDSFEILDSDSFDEDAVTTGKGKYTYKTGDLLERSLHNGKIKYYIPQRWEQTEHNIETEELGKIEGYQYRLNELNRGAEFAQSLFVCYFDIERFVALNDRGDMGLIEEAILRNITGKENLKDFPVRKVDTYYGAEYKYYQDSYEKISSSDLYQTEYAFQEIDSGGILMYLYVYSTPNEDQGRIKEEALMVMRLLEAQ